MTDSFKLAILGGTGAQGGGLALRWAQAGHRVIIGSRDVGKAEATAADINLRVGAQRASAKNIQDAAAEADIVVLSVPHAAQRTTAMSAIAGLRGKILVDTTVPLMPPKVARVQLPADGSATASLQRLLGDEVRVVAAFQNVSAHHLSDLAHHIACDVLVCGNDIQARDTVISLAKNAGMRGVHAGPIDNAVAVEAMTSLLISINGRYKVPGAGIAITGLPENGAV